MPIKGICLLQFRGNVTMEYRKLISFGKSSFVVSLPKTWVVQNKLKKGDLIYFDEKDNNLFLSFTENKHDEEKKKTIDVDGKEFFQIKRELNAAYIENYREIVFKGKEIKDKSKEILEYVRELIALEVLEIDSTKIVTKDFLDMDHVSVQDLVKKMDIIIRSMLKDCSLTFQENNAENLNLRDKDVNRLSYLLYRAIRFGIENPSKMLKKFGISPIDLLNYYWLTFHLEAIADEAKRVARTMNKITISKDKQQEFEQLLRQAEDLYVEIIKAYYKNDRDRGLLLSNKKHILVRTANTFLEKNPAKNNGELGYMIDRYRRMVSAIHEISRLTYQH